MVFPSGEGGVQVTEILVRPSCTALTPLGGGGSAGGVKMLQYNESTIAQNPWRICGFASDDGITTNCT